MNYYINFLGGTYGHFLEYIINRFVFKIDYGNTTEHTLFNLAGASHLRDEIYIKNRKIVCTHHDFSYDGIDGLSNFPITPGDFVVTISLNFSDRYDFIYNQHTRAGGVNIDFDNLEINTLEKISDQNLALKQIIIDQFGIGEIYPKQGIRNLFFSMFFDKQVAMNRVITPNYSVSPMFSIPIDSFLDFSKFVQQIKDLAAMIDSTVEININELFQIWKIFDSKNISKKSKIKCAEILNAIQLGESIPVNCNIIEEAWINCNIAEIYNINREIDCFTDAYPKDTLDIRNQINKYLIMRTLK
jgi:hypothetical protein